MTNLSVPHLDLAAYMREVGERARAAARLLARAPTKAKDAALEAAAAAIARDGEALLDANAADVAASRSAGDDDAFIDRLALNEKRIAAMADGLRQIAALPDPVGEITELKYRPTGIQVGRMRVPLGVVGIIYESRPNVTADAAALCFKSGNAAILRGGSEAMRSNQAIAARMHEGLAAAGLPADAVQAIATSDRAAVGMLATMDRYVVDGRKRGMKVVTSVPTEMTTTAARARSTGFSYRLLKFIRDLLPHAAWGFRAVMPRL